MSGLPHPADVDDDDDEFDDQDDDAPDLPPPPKQVVGTPQIKVQQQQQQPQQHITPQQTTASVKQVTPVTQPQPAPAAKPISTDDTDEPMKSIQFPCQESARQRTPTHQPRKMSLSSSALTEPSLRYVCLILHCREGDIIEIISMEDEVWWQGRLRGKEGLFPTSYVELI